MHTRLLHGSAPNTSEMKAVVDQTLNACRGTEQFIDLVATFHRTDRAADVLTIALDNPTSSLVTRRILGWQPVHPGLIADFDHGDYFTAP